MTKHHEHTTWLFSGIRSFYCHRHRCKMGRIGLARPNLVTDLARPWSKLIPARKPPPTHPPPKRAHPMKGIGPTQMRWPSPNQPKLLLFVCLFDFLFFEFLVCFKFWWHIWKVIFGSTWNVVNQHFFNTWEIPSNRVIEIFFNNFGKLKYFWNF